MNMPSTLDKQTYYALAAIAGLVLLLVAMEGGFHAKVAPGTAQAVESTPEAVRITVKVTAQNIPDVRLWPATVSARSLAQVAPKVAARVLEIPVKAGDRVRAGQLLARLDDSELRSRLHQAKSAVAAAAAEAGRASADAQRMRNLYGREAATRQDLDAAQAQARATAAQAAEARAGVAVAESLLAETALRAPFDGAVVQRLLEPGDMAMPGAPVLLVQTSARLRVEAAIPESCAAGLKPGEQLSARLGETDHPVTVEEIAPAADPRTRTVLVKTSLDAPAQPGAFAWLVQPCGEHRALLIPADAVTRSGQLETVRVVHEGKTLLRHVRTGKAYDGQVEILSGLQEGEHVAVVESEKR